MKYNPHSYQEYTTNFIMNNPIAAILLDMGMGKTSIVLGRFIGQYREAYFNGDPYENLANAIVLSAVEDYRKALRRLSKILRAKAQGQMWIHWRDFFRSSWYSALTSIEGEFLIRKLHEEYNI